MKVTTKFNIGDVVWYVSDNKVNKLDVTGVVIDVDDTGTKIEYYLHYDIKLTEEELFKTKEELLESL